MDDLKKQAAEKATEFVKTDMFVGLGTGSTAKFVVEDLGHKVQRGELIIKATPTSIATKELAESFGIPMVDLKEIKDKELDLVIDGADQIDLETGICIKGGGGAHYWEKKVAKKSKKMIVVVDESKIVTDFVGYKIPLEVVPGYKNELEKKGVVFREKRSDFGNLVGDMEYDGKVSLEEFKEELMNWQGVLDTGIFKDLVNIIVVAYKDGRVETVVL